MSLESHFDKKFNQETKDNIANAFLTASATLWVFGFLFSNQNNISPTQTSLSRYSVATLMSYIIATSTNSGWNMSNRSSVIRLLLRSVILVIHSYVVSIVPFYLPQNIYHVLGCTGPMFTFIANYLFNGIKASRIQIIGVFTTFFGLIFVVNSKLFLQFFTESSQSNDAYEFQTKFKNYKTDDIFVQIIVSILYLLWVFMWTISIIFTKIQQYNSAQMLFVCAFIGVQFYALVFSYYDENQKVSNQTYFLSLLWVGIPISMANILFNSSIKLVSNVGKASTLVCVVQAIVAYFVSIWRYGQKINLFALFGTFVIVTSVIVVLREKINPNTEKRIQDKQKQLNLSKNTEA